MDNKTNAGEPSSPAVCSENLKPYIPSNGSEGEFFMEKYCYQCAKWEEDMGCKIQTRTMAFNPGEKEYPKEWVAVDGYKNARCTAFIPNATNLPEREAR